MKIKIFLLEIKMFNQATLQKLLPFILFILLNSCSYVIKNNANAICVDGNGCHLCKVYFTHKVRKQLERTGINIEKIQYFNSREIILTRTISKKHMSISEGVVKSKNGKLTEEICITKMTPGICLCKNSNTLYMSFGNDTRFALPFKRKNDYGPYHLSHQKDHIVINNIRYKLAKGKSSTLKIQKYERKAMKIRKEILNGRLITNK